MTEPAAKAPRRRRQGLESRLVAALRQALAEDRADVAEHLLCALETLNGAKGRPVAAEAYLLIAALFPERD
jgi:hypothetical protein